ncbi:MAG: hypothetical protein ACTHMV_15110 [Chitinophagaceae bacterium]
MNKEDDFEYPHAYKPIMAGLFAGIVASLLNIFYDAIFRGATGYSLPELINVSTIIFGTLFILFVAGTVFAIMDRYMKHATVPYIILFVVLTLLCVQLALHVNRTDNLVQKLEFRQLLVGVVIISGASAAFLVPFLVKRPTGIV